MAIFNFGSPTTVGNVQDGSANNQATTVGQVTTVVQQSNTFLQSVIVQTANVNLIDAYANDYATLQVSKTYTDNAIASIPTANTEASNAYTDQANTFLQGLISNTAVQTLADAHTYTLQQIALANTDIIAFAYANDVVTFDNAVSVSEAYTDATNAWLQAHGTMVNPGGVDGSIQFNNGGAFGGGSGLVWDSANNTLTTGNILATSSIDATTLYSPNAYILSLSTDGIRFTDGTSQNSAANIQVALEYTDVANAYLRGVIAVSSSEDRSYTDAEIANNNASFVTPAITSAVTSTTSTLTTLISTTSANDRIYTDSSNSAMKSYVDGVSVADRAYTDASNTAMQGYVDGSIISARADAQTYTDASNTWLQGYINVSDANNLVLAKQYTDTANGFNTVQTALALQNAKSYTDVANTYLQGLITGEGSAITQANTWLQAYASANDFVTLTEAKNYTDVIKALVDIEISASANNLQNSISSTSVADRAYTDTANTYLQNLLSTSVTSLDISIGASEQRSKDYSNTVLIEAYANDVVTLTASKEYTDATNTWLQLNLTAGGNISNSLIQEANNWLQANDSLTLAAAQAFTTNTTASILGSANIYTDSKVNAANVFLQANDASTLTVAESYTDTANVFLQANDRSVLTLAETYTDTTNIALQVIFNTALSQSQSLQTAYTNAANTFLQANDAVTLSVALAYTDSANAWLQANFVGENTAIGQANTWLQANDFLTLTSAEAYTNSALTSGLTNITANTVGANTVVLPGGVDLSARVTTTNIILANTVLDTFSSTEYRSVKYTVQVTSGSDSQISEILLIHDGTTAYATEYAVIVTNYTLASFAADVVGNEVRLLLTPTNADNTIRIYKTLFNV